MTQSSAIVELGNSFLIIGLPLIAGLIAFLSYLRGHFNHLAKTREFKEREANQNREMYIKMIVQNTMDVQMKEIHDMIAKITERIDQLFALLKNER
ncbi:MAG TPA: hypothetical protein PLD87_11695 [Bacteroidia bacterium]|nr:hypothetical protein [Bacteroidia bacterium]